MKKLFVFFAFLLPLACLAQFNVTGKILNKADGKPVANASVFLSNSTNGEKTDIDGNFTLHDVQFGKYDLIVSVVGFETFSTAVIKSNTDLLLAPIHITPKSIALNEVVIKPDANRERNYTWFKEQFLGTSELAKQCRILNPEILDLDYDDATKILTASSTDFLEIENPALGYKIKCLLTTFNFENTGDFKIYYKGSILYQQMRGTVSQLRSWQNQREEVYENSEMHFLRAASANRLQENGFSIQLLANYANPRKTG